MKILEINFFLLRDCFYVPKLNRNFVSVSILIEHGYSLFFMKVSKIEENSPEARGSELNVEKVSC